MGGCAGGAKRVTQCVSISSGPRHSSLQPRCTPSGFFFFGRWNAVDVAMHADTAKLLRELAQACIKLARNCPHRETSLGLEEVAISLATKAEELERELELRP